MFDSDDFDTDGTIVFRDLITLALAGFVACIVVLLPHINPAKAKLRTESAEPSGNVVIEIRWPDSSTPTSIFGCRDRVMSRSAIQTRVVGSSTSCVMIWVIVPTFPGSTMRSPTRAGSSRGNMS